MVLAARGARRIQGAVEPIRDISLALRLRQKAANIVSVATLVAVLVTTAFSLVFP